MPGPSTCQVETYSGGSLHERPRRFTWQGEWLEVQQVLDRWRDPDHLHFRVAAANGRVYLLSYHGRGDTWKAELAEARRCGVSRDQG